MPNPDDQVPDTARFALEKPSVRPGVDCDHGPRAAGRPSSGRPRRMAGPQELPMWVEEARQRHGTGVQPSCTSRCRSRRPRAERARPCTTVSIRSPGNSARRSSARGAVGSELEQEPSRSPDRPAVRAPLDRCHKLDLVRRSNARDGVEIDHSRGAVASAARGRRCKGHASRYDRTAGAPLELTSASTSMRAGVRGGANPSGASSAGSSAQDRPSTRNDDLRAARLARAAEGVGDGTDVGLN